MMASPISIHEESTSFPKCSPVITISSPALAMGGLISVIEGCFAVNDVKYKISTARQQKTRRNTKNLKIKNFLNK